MSTFEATLHQLPKPILNKLRAMISRVRRLLLIRGLFATLAVALTCILLIMAIDASVTLFSNTARWALSLTGLGITSVAAWWFLLRPLSRRFTLTQIARILEIRHPELQERISTAVELMSSDDPDSIRGSEELIEAVVDSAVIDVEAVDPKTEFKAARASKFVMASGVVALLIALLFVIWPTQSWTLMARAIAPFMNIGNAYADTLVVDPGDVRIAVGETVTIKLSVQHKKLRKAQIRRSLAGNSETVERMTLVKTEEDGTRHFEISFPSVEESFVYRVRAGAAVSEFFQVEAVPKPVVDNLSLRYDFPAYTGRSPEEFETDTGEIKALAHTQITVTADLNKPVTEAKLLINEAFEPASAEIVGNRATWRFELRPGTQGVWKIALSDADEFSNSPPNYSILAVPDEKPRLAITSPEARELRLKPSELLPIKFQVVEDYGFSQIDLLVTPNGEQNPIELIQPTPESDGQAGVWRGTAPLDLTSLDLEARHNRLTVQLRVRDNMPEEYQGPNVGLSEKIVIILDRGAKSLAEQTMEAQKKEIQEAIDEAQKELTQAKNEAMKAERQLAREDAVSQDTMQDLEDFRENTNTAQETLREVAERLDDTVFNQEAEQLEKIADEEVAEAREAADMIPVTDKKEERVAEAREAGEQIDQALKELQEIENSLRKPNEDLKMIADLNNLANEQRNLAQQAQKNAEQQQQQEQAQNEPQAQRQQQQQQQQMQQFQRQQQQVQNELGKMLKENPEALQEILEQQQRQAEQLAEQAEQMAQRQEEVREMTQNAAGEEQQQSLQDQLVAQLQQMQEQVARETQELQTQLNEQQQDSGEPLDSAAEQTQEAAEKLQQENLAEAADTAQEAAEALAQAQEQSEAMAEQQADNAEAMQAKAETPEQPDGQQPDTQSPQSSPPGEPTPSEPAPGDPKMAEAQPPGESPPGEPAPSEPSPGEPAASEAQAQAQAQAQSESSESPPPGEPAPPEMAQAQSESQPGESSESGEPEAGEPQSSPLATEETRAQLTELAETQEMIAQQLEAIEAGQLEDALAMMEEQLAEQSESLQAESEALEQATRAANQQSAAARADQAENQLENAMRQTDQAQQQLTQAQQAQDAAEQQGQQPAGQTSPQARQSMSRSQGSQQQARQSMNQAAQSLQQTAEALAQAIEGIESGEMEEQVVDGQELAESFDEVTESAESQNAQQAAEQSQQAAQSLQQLAQAAMEQMSQGQPQDQPGQEGQQPPQPGEFVDGSQELNESGQKTADVNGDGVPPELKALGISIEDWSRLKGTLQSGSASQKSGGVSAEYRDLVSRYFQVIAREAGKRE